MAREIPKCPLCLSGDLNHEQVGETHIYICDECPFVGLEFVLNEDVDNLSKRLKQN